ncbi:DUF192 domain-containing protein [Roseibium sp. CAU 1637]|uniref:DUF192 domain-containing protein n=1 Tax=Roseibium limicola TaxID=2816037 RepID=A0A939EL11_9HYPH|nr:DUF192 domain-containing protein [Roseibium limicola]MBO0344635.1 DUF192 domain-containing protein [Roseibium limicola]
MTSFPGVQKISEISGISGVARSAIAAALLLVSATVASAQTAERVALSIHTPEMVHAFQVEVARTDSERARGLMHREDMAVDQGMLFIFEAAGQRYFWMKDTPLSLDIIFVDEDGEIIRIADHTVPFSENIVPSNGDALYVLELLAGTSEELGITEGDRLVSEAMNVPKNP